MVRYRRSFVPGGTFFFTATLRDRRSRVLTYHVAALRSAFCVARQKQPFVIDAIVVLPDHLHTVCTLPSDDHDFSRRWRRIKSHFTRAIVNAGVFAQRNARGEYDLWQRRFSLRRLHPFQSREAWARRGVRRLAAFVIASAYPARRS